MPPETKNLCVFKKGVTFFFFFLSHIVCYTICSMDCTTFEVKAFKQFHSCSKNNNDKNLKLYIKHFTCTQSSVLRI